MAKEEENKNSGKQHQPAENVLQGRVHNSQNPEFEKAGSGNDISNIDQQEGNMQHGESGGNLNPEKESR